MLFKLKIIYFLHLNFVQEEIFLIECNLINLYLKKMQEYISFKYVWLYFISMINLMSIET